MRANDSRSHLTCNSAISSLLEKFFLSVFLNPILSWSSARNWFFSAQYEKETIRGIEWSNFRGNEWDERKWREESKCKQFQSDWSTHYWRDTRSRQAQAIKRTTISYAQDWPHDRELLWDQEPHLRSQHTTNEPSRCFPPAHLSTAIIQFVCNSPMRIIEMKGNEGRNWMQALSEWLEHESYRTNKWLLEILLLSPVKATRLNTKRTTDSPETSRQIRSHSRRFCLHSLSFCFNRLRMTGTATAGFSYRPCRIRIRAESEQNQN